MSKYSLKISGPAGAGIMQAGETFSKALNRLGFYTLVYPEYPSQIRGGDNHVQVVFSTEENPTPEEKVDLLLAFNSVCLKNHQKEVKKQGQVLSSEGIGLEEIAQKMAQPLVKNTAGLGYLWSFLGFDFTILKKQISQDLVKDQKLLSLNLQAAEEGFQQGKNCKKSNSRRILPPKSLVPIVNLTGNEALVKGILAAKCDFAAIYPMTPINAVLSLLAKEEILIFRPEDEIAGIMAAIGAAYAGKRALVATSGGGFSLMVEGLGLAGMAEVPLVIVLGQRTGPSSGIPTYSSQADLQFVINAGQGEFPRIVLAPGDLGELFSLGAEAFNLAEVYQVPVILMTDKYLAESRFSEKTSLWPKAPLIKRGELVNAKALADYRRYRLTADGISPRAFPGQTAFLTNSYEHDERGFSTDEADMRGKMMDKRMKKLDQLGKGFSFYQNLGTKKNTVKGKRTTLVSWGSTKGVLLAFVKNHPQCELMHFWRPWPFPPKAKEILKKAERVVVVEGNYSGQMAAIIERESGLRVEKILKDDGRPFFDQDLERMIKV